MAELLTKGRVLTRLVTFTASKFGGGIQPRVGILRDADQSVVDVASVVPPATKAHVVDMQTLIEAGAEVLAAVRQAAQQETVPAEAVALAREVTLHAPLPRPRRNVFCLGKNYSEHVTEMKTAFAHSALPPGVELPPFPIFFTKCPDCVIGPLDYIETHERISSQLDYEAEMVVVIGKVRDHGFVGRVFLCFETPTPQVVPPSFCVAAATGRLVGTSPPTAPWSTCLVTPSPTT